jgi:glycoprotein-N-acetylgalactosamine 3-beta-galactosyltransferase
MTFSWEKEHLTAHIPDKVPITTPSNYQIQQRPQNRSVRIRSEGVKQERIKQSEKKPSNYSFHGTKSKFVDLTYAGAKYSNGTLGLIENPSPQRLARYNRTNLGNNNNGSSGSIICPLSEYGIEGAGGHKVLLKIKRGLEKSRKFIQLQAETIISDVSSTSNNTNLTSTVFIGQGNITARARRSKILCLVYTTHLPPSYENLNLKAQAETWGSECDGFIAASNYTDDSVGSIDLVHNGPEIYSNMWQKIRSIWAYTYKNYRNDFDYFHICGDDVYIVVDNLRAYLDGPEVTRLENGYKDRLSRDFDKWKPEWGPRPLLLGTPMLHRKIIAIAGGPGYTLNRAALEILNKQLPKFQPYTQDSREDVFLASALYKFFGMSDTRDSNGSKRYGESAEFLFNFDGKAFDAPKFFARAFKMPSLPLGIDVVSEQFISFHLKFENQKLPNLMYRYHSIFNDWCNGNHT